jgi:hypothetical protein
MILLKKKYMFKYMAYNEYIWLKIIWFWDPSASMLAISSE